MTPERLKVVVTPLIRHQHVNDDIAVIEKSPAPLIESFLAQGLQVGLSLQAILNRPGNSTNLNVGLTAGNHHPIRQAGHLIDADQTDVGGLPVIAGIGSIQQASRYP